MGILAGTRSGRREQRGTGRWVMVPREVTAPMRRRSRVIQRRRRIFSRLVAVAIVSAVAGLAPPLRWLWWVHLAADTALTAYVWHLLRLKQIDDTRPVPATASEPVFDVERALAPGLIAASQPPVPHAAPPEIALPVDAGLITRTG